MRPLSSFRSVGIATVPRVATGNGAANVTCSIVARVFSSSLNTGAIVLPSASVRRTAVAALIGTGSENRRYAFSTGLHPAAVLTREHSNRAVKGLRTVKSKRWSAPASLPPAPAMLLPQTSAMSRPGGSGRRHFKAVTPASARWRSAGSLGMVLGSPALSRKFSTA